MIFRLHTWSLKPSALLSAPCLLFDYNRLVRFLPLMFMYIYKVHFPIYFNVLEDINYLATLLIRDKLKVRLKN